MKTLKILALIVAGVLLLAFAVLGIAMIPAVQTSVARRLLAGRPGTNVEFGRLAVGPAGIDIRDLRTRQNGTVVTAARVTVRGSLWDYLVRGQVNLEEIAISGLQVDARQAAAAPAPATAPAVARNEQAAEPPPGLAIFGLARPLPLELRLGRLACEGRVLLPDDRRVDFSVQGGGIAVGEQGRFQWKSDYADPAAGAAVKAVHVTGALNVHLATGRRIDSASLEAVVAAEGPRLPADQIRFEVKADQPSPESPEAVDAHLGLVRSGAVTPLANARMELHPAPQNLTGTWDVAVGSDQIAALCAGLALPDFAVNGGGKFAYEGATQSGTASGALDARVSGLDRVGPGFAGVGTLDLHTAFDGSVGRDLVRVGRLELAVATPDGRRIAQVSAAQALAYHPAEGRFELTKPDENLAVISIADLPLAWVQPFIKPVTIEHGTISGGFTVAVGAGGLETRLRAVQPLVFNGVTVRDQDRNLVSGMTVSLSPEVGYSADRVTAEVPDLKVLQPAGDSVDGSFSIQATHPSTGRSVSFRAQLQERLVAVQRPFLPEGAGAVRVETTAEGVLEGQNLRLQRFASTVRNDGGALVAAIETLQPVTVNLATERLAASNAGSPAARLQLGELPLGLAGAFVPHTAMTGALAGGTVELTLSGPDQFALQTTSPLMLRGAGLARDGRRMIQSLDVAADFSAAWHGGAIAAEIRRLEVTRGPAALVQLTGTGDIRPGGKLIASGKGRLEADLAALGGQPVLASLGALGRGRLTLDYDVNTGDAVRAKVALALRDLAVRGNNQPLGDLEVSAEATLKPDGSGGAVQMPLKLTVGDRPSDLLFDGNFSRAASVLTFNGKLLSKQIFTADFRPLAALMPSVPAAGVPATAAPAGPAPVTPAAAAPAPTTSGEVATAAGPDTKPFWADLQGRFDLDLKRIEYGAGSVISGVSGALVAEPTRLAVDNFAGQLKDQPFKIAGAITFTGGQPEPYALDGAVNLAGFDVGAILRAASPGDPPALESVLAINGKVTGRGPNLPALAQASSGQFEVSGSKGVLRALGKRGGLAGAASLILGLVGAMENSAGTMAAAELARMMKEMPFDSLTAHLERGADLNLKLTSLELISPTIHLTGTGGIQYQKGVPIADQPLQVQLQLAGKGEMALALSRIHLLSGQQDAKQYYLMNTPFIVKGTLAKPDSNQFWAIVAKAALSR